MIALPILLLSLLFAHAAHGAEPPATATPAATSSAAPTPAPQPSAAATALPSATPAAGGTPAAGATPPAGAGPSPAPASPGPPAPSLEPSPAVSASSSPSPYTYRFVPHQPPNVQPGQPVIVAVYLNSRRLRSEGPILIKVQTNEAVIKVVSRSNGREGGIPRVTPGDFEAASKLPKLPFIASGMTIDLEFIATSADGRKTSVRVPVKLN